MAVAVAGRLGGGRGKWAGARSRTNAAGGRFGWNDGGLWVER